TDYDSAGRSTRSSEAPKAGDSVALLGLPGLLDGVPLPVDPAVLVVGIPERRVVGADVDVADTRIGHGHTSPRSGVQQHGLDDESRQERLGKPDARVLEGCGDPAERSRNQLGLR